MDRQRALGGGAAWLAGLGAAVVVVYALLHRSPASDLLYLVTGTTSVVTMVCGVLYHRPDRSAAWVLLTAGQAAWVVGDWVTSRGPDQSVVINSPGDLFYSCAYPLLVAGVWKLARPRGGAVDRGSLIDSAIATTGVALVSWTFVTVPLLSGSSSRTQQVSGVLYPLGDLLVVAVLGYLVSAGGARSTSFWLVVGALVPTTVGDSLFTAADAVPVLEPVAHTLWLSAYVLWAVAAVHPSMTRVVSGERPAGPGLSPLRILSLVAAVLLAPTVLALQEVWGTIGSAEIWAFVVGTTVLDGLVLVRMCLAVAQARIATRERDRLMGDLDFQAAHDSVTGLANRMSVLELARAAMSRARARGDAVGVIVVDLDEFRSLNDTMGHHVADQVLGQVARRIRAQTREEDVVGRLGGDEFVVVVDHVQNEQHLARVCDRILDAVSEPLDTSGGPTVVTACGGYTYDPHAAAHPPQLLHEADLALVRAKSSGRGRAALFDADLRAEALRRSDLETALRAGLDAGELVVHYQPVVDLGRGAVRGYEALVRWDRPGHGLLAPGHFMDVAESSDLICLVDRWVLRQAARQIADWNARRPGDEPLTVAVNVSGRHLLDANVVDDVADGLAAAGLDPAHLVLEITETVLVDVPTAVEALRALRDLGVTVSIDDFGTGYTSINQLQLLPAHTLKIDRSFVSDTSPGSAELLALIISAAHGCGLRVIAEGVETKDQLDRVRDLGCDAVQGFLLGRPTSAADTEARSHATATGALAPTIADAERLQGTSGERYSAMASRIHRAR